MKSFRIPAFVILFLLSSSFVVYLSYVRTMRETGDKKGVKIFLDSLVSSPIPLGSMDQSQDLIAGIHSRLTLPNQNHQRKKKAEELLQSWNIQVDTNSKIEIAPNTFQFKQKQKIEGHHTQKQCYNEKSRQFNVSAEFNCAVMHDPRVPEKIDRIIYFDKLCSPEVTVNTEDQSISTKRFSRCSYFEYENVDGELGSSWKWICIPSYMQYSPEKTGTTTMYYTITSHPEIFRNVPQSGEKEPNFLSGKIRSNQSPDPILYLQSICDPQFMLHANEMETAIQHGVDTNSIPTICSPILCGDHSTQYPTADPGGTLANIKQSFPDTKFFMFMREPISRIESHVNFFNRFITTDEQLGRLMGSLIAKAKQKVSSLPLPLNASENYPLDNLTMCYEAQKQNIELFELIFSAVGGITRSMYWIPLSHFFDEFDHSDIFITFSEFLKQPSDEQRLLTELFSFLGVSPFIETKEELENSNLNINEHRVHLLPEIKSILGAVMKPHVQKLSEILHLSPSHFPDQWLYLL